MTWESLPDTANQKVSPADGEAFVSSIAAPAGAEDHSKSLALLPSHQVYLITASIFRQFWVASFKW